MVKFLVDIRFKIGINSKIKNQQCGAIHFYSFLRSWIGILKSNRNSLTGKRGNRDEETNVDHHHRDFDDNDWF
jgi:hypothetical protein